MPQSLATYRDQGNLRRLSATPVPPARVLGAQLVVNASLAVVAPLLLVVVGTLAFGVAAPNNSAALALAMLRSLAAIFPSGKSSPPLGEREGPAGGRAVRGAGLRCGADRGGRS
jgi:ABC-2 type transport system permease protein